MDIFYYSKLCPHSQKIIQFIVKHQLQSKLSCICVDKRKRDVNNNQTMVVLENGKQVMLPPNLQSVPAVLCIKRNYVLIVGTDPILDYFKTAFNLGNTQLFENPYESPVNRRPQEREPTGVGFNTFLGNSGIMSEQYTGYNLSPDDLSAVSSSERRPMHGYTKVGQHIVIETPEDTWRPDKVASNVTVDMLQQQRNMEIPVAPSHPPSELYGSNGGAPPPPPQNLQNMMLPPFKPHL